MKSILLLSLVLFSIQSESLANDKPNILVILADDLGYADVGFTGAKDIYTPVLDKLAANGVNIKNGYVTHPYCGPSRAGLITGRYQARFGLEINLTNSPFDQYNGLPTSEQTFATRLKKSGYKTGIIGKWHNGSSPVFHPNNRGFDEFFGFLGGGHSYFPESVNTLIPLSLDRNLGDRSHYSANEGTEWPLSRNNKGAEFTEYLTTQLSREAANFVTQSEDPFMLYLAYNAPHTPLEAPKETIQKYSHIKNKKRRVYAAMIDEMDKGIGMVVDSLEKSGKLDNTLIFFLSDNGGAASPSQKHPKGKVLFSDSGPYRDGKGSMHEGGSHVPFIIHWPNGINKKGDFNGLVSALDIAATAVAVGEGDSSGKPLDGKNLIPYLNGEKSGSPHQALYWRTQNNKFAIRTEEAKLLTEPWGAGEPELYNMVSDPYEKNNIIDQEPEKRVALAKLWNQWNNDNINNIYLPARAYQEKRLDFYKQLYNDLKAQSEKRPPLIVK